MFLSWCSPKIAVNLLPLVAICPTWEWGISCLDFQCQSKDTLHGTIRNSLSLCSVACSGQFRLHYSEGCSPDVVICRCSQTGISSSLPFPLLLLLTPTTRHLPRQHQLHARVSLRPQRRPLPHHRDVLPGEGGVPGDRVQLALGGGESSQEAQETSPAIKNHLPLCLK